MAQLYMTLYNMMIYLGFAKKGFQKIEHQQFWDCPDGGFLWMFPNK
jgi:hypothetical protein